MAEEEEFTERQERRVRVGQTIRVVVVLAAVVLLVLFALVNTGEVEIDYLFGTVDAPMIIVIVVSAAIGFVIGLVGRFRRT